MIQLIKKCDSESAHVTHAFTLISNGNSQKENLYCIY